MPHAALDAEHEDTADDGPRFGRTEHELDIRPPPLRWRVDRRGVVEVQRDGAACPEARDYIKFSF